VRVRRTRSIRPARSGDLHIAYQVIGTGPFDLVFMHGWISHIEHMWEVVAGSGIPFEDRGRHSLKGVPGEWLLFAVAADLT
jgi:hypothetical protein